MFLLTSVSLKPSCDGLPENAGGGGSDAPYLTHNTLAGSQHCSAFWVTETEMGMHG